MAAPVLTFTREPVTGGDLGAWAPYLIAQTRGGGLGALSLELYDNGGDLNMREGFAGINDGVTRGMIECTTEGTIDTVGMTANNWHQVEMSVSGASVTLSISAIAGETDESLIPTTVKAAYNAAKQGYYMTASKRLVGVVFLRTALALGTIINCEHGKRGFKDLNEIEEDDSGTRTFFYIKTNSIILPEWNMDTTASLSLNTGLYCTTTGTNAFRRRIIDAFVMVIDDAYQVQSFDGGGYITAVTVTSYIQYIVLSRNAGGIFDAALYDGTGFSRGIMSYSYKM